MTTLTLFLMQKKKVTFGPPSGSLCGDILHTSSSLLTTCDEGLASPFPFVLCLGFSWLVLFQPHAKRLLGT